MTSILDQYEASKSSIVLNYNKPAITEPIGTGYVDAKLEDYGPLLNKQKINFTPPDPITHLVASNNFLVLGMTSNILFRIDLFHSESHDEVEIPKAVEDRINNLFQDPSGRHLIVSMQSGDSYYLSRNSKKPRHLSKLKGNHISAIGWNRENTTDTSTGEILVGTSKGLIFETEILFGEDGRLFQSNTEQYVKLLYNVGKDHPRLITGLNYQKMPQLNANENRYFIMATTPGRLYQFLGSTPAIAEQPIFISIFSNYEGIPERFIELPGEIGYSELHFFHSRFQDIPKAFAWMTGPGIYFGHIDVTGSFGENSVIMDARLIDYLKSDAIKNINPLAIAMTEFHLIVMFPDRLNVTCVLNEQLVYDDYFSDKIGNVLGMCKDPMKGTIWVYTKQAVFKYKMVQETRDVWKMYLDKQEFELAKQYCKDNPANRDKVYTCQAEHCFENCKYLESAHFYALTQNSFEEIALKFIELKDKEPLKTFLFKKLDSLKSQDKMQSTMLITWLIELFLNQLGILKESDNDEDYQSLQELFRQFLAQPRVRDCVSFNRGSIYDLIASHGNVEDMIFFADLMKDYERVITHYIQHDNFIDALDKLKRQSNPDLFYSFSPILMQNIPKETVDVWISKSIELDPKRLIPSLVQYDHNTFGTQYNEAIRYLEFCVNNMRNRDQPIHNYLISLYAKVQPDELLKYLHFQGQDPDLVSYDLKYALRLCSEHDHKKACIHIYSTMGLYEEAVSLALKIDVDIAKQNAEKPEDDEELRKKLWLHIARHVVEENKDIKRAMEFLHECDLLKIEDILPFFPDFVTIDHFKDAICTSLQEYNQHIESLKLEMEDATESAKEIRSDIQIFRNKYAHIKSTDHCKICNYSLLTKNFHIFPCTHCFHSDCLINEVIPHLSISERTLVDELQRQIQTKGPQNSTSLSADSSAQIYKEKLDDIVAAECILCGDMMINSIDEPFIAPNEYTAVIQSWL